MVRYCPDFSDRGFLEECCRGKEGLGARLVILLMEGALTEVLANVPTRVFWPAQGPVRQRTGVRRMPRGNRCCPGGTVFHVLNRGNGRQTHFHEPSDYEAFV